MRNPSGLAEKHRDFTLETDPVPETLQLADISRRARSFLRDGSEKELADIGLALGLSIALYKENEFDDLRSLVDTAIAGHDFGAWVAAPGWSWQEGFALFALLKVREALRHLESHPSLAAECALEAMEAVGYADVLEAHKEAGNAREKEPDRDLREQIAGHNRDRARKAANERHDRTTRPLKEEAIRLYEARKWRSVLQAAKEIYPKLEQFIEAKGIPFRFSSERGPKTIYDWLRAHRKKIVAESA
jgi:hypothetical protein